MRDIYPILTIYLDVKINLFNNKDIYNELVQNFEKILSKYYVDHDAGQNDIIFTINAFNDKRIIDKIKQFIQSKPYITKASFYNSNDELDEENIWKYKKK